MTGLLKELESKQEAYYYRKLQAAEYLNKVIININKIASETDNLIELGNYSEIKDSELSHVINALTNYGQHPRSRVNAILKSLIKNDCLTIRAEPKHLRNLEDSLRVIKVNDDNTINCLSINGRVTDYEELNKILELKKQGHYKGRINIRINNNKITRVYDSCQESINDCMNIIYSNKR